MTVYIVRGDRYDEIRKVWAIDISASGDLALYLYGVTYPIIYPHGSYEYICDRAHCPEKRGALYEGNDED